MTTMIISDGRPPITRPIKTKRAHRTLSRLIYLTALAGLTLNALAEPGDDIAAEMTRYYLSTVESCADGQRPAYYCSGLMIKNTRARPGHYAWNPGRAAVSSGGTSFIYLRADTRFNNPDANTLNGFVFYPYGHAHPPIKKAPQVLCAFPLTTWTHKRDDKGCGDQFDTSAVETSCEALNIHTAEDWVDDHLKTDGNLRKQCGFREVSGRFEEKGAQHFYASLKARSLLLKNSDQLEYDTFETPNKLRLSTWAENPDSLPIMAFFYVDDPYLGSGLAAAQQDQLDWVVENKRAYTPIIKITYPATMKEHAVFTFNQADQRVCPTYFVSSRWVLKEGKWWLVVTPSACSQAVALFNSQAASKELMALHGADAEFNALAPGHSIAEQLQCQASRYRSAAQWHLAPWRSVEGLTQAQVLTADCQP